MEVLSFYLGNGRIKQFDVFLFRQEDVSLC